MLYPVCGFFISSCSSGKTEAPKEPNPVDESGKAILTLGVFSNDKDNKISPHRVEGVAITEKVQYIDIYSYLVGAARQFSKTSDKYTIEIKDYGPCEDADAVSRFNTEVTAGKIPDMMLLVGTPYEDYVRKGLFTDLYPFIDSESNSFKREDLFPGLLKAMEYKGGLYWISPENIALTLFGKKSMLGDSGGLDGSRLLEVWNNFSLLPVQSKEYADLKKSITYNFYKGRGVNSNELLNILLNSIRGKFIEYDTGACNFNTKEFIDFLKLCDSLPSDLEDNTYDATNNPDAFTVSKDLEMMDCLESDSIQQYEILQCFFSRDDLAFIGVPGSSPAAGLCVPYLPLAISAHSNCKEGAWDFFQYLINRAFKTYFTTYSLPLSKTVYEKALIEPPGVDIFEIWKKGDLDKARGNVFIRVKIMKLLHSRGRTTI